MLYLVGAVISIVLSTAAGIIGILTFRAAARTRADQKAARSGELFVGESAETRQWMQEALGRADKERTASDQRHHDEMQLLRDQMDINNARAEAKNRDCDERVRLLTIEVEALKLRVKELSP